MGSASVVELSGCAPSEARDEGFESEMSKSEGAPSCCLGRVGMMTDTTLRDDRQQLTRGGKEASLYKVEADVIVTL